MDPTQQMAFYSSRLCLAMDEALAERPAQLSLATATIMLLGSMLGPSILQYPKIYFELGYGISTALLVSTCVLNSASIYFIVKSSRISETDTIGDLWGFVAGPAGRYMISVATFLMLGYPLVNYLLFCGEFLRTAALQLGLSFLTPQLCILLSVALIAVSCLLSNGMMHRIVPIVFVGIALLFALLAFVAYDASTNYAERIEFKWNGWHNGGRCSLPWIGAILFGFVCQTNALQIFSTTGGLSEPSLCAIVVLSNGLVLGMYMLMAILGLAITPSPSLNFLNGAISTHPAEYFVLRIFLAVSTITTYPLTIYSASECIDELFFRRPPAHPGSRAAGETILIILGTWALCFVPKIVDSLAFLFAICSSCIVFFFPGIAYLVVVRKKGERCTLLAGGMVLASLVFGMLSLSIGMYPAK